MMYDLKVVPFKTEERGVRDPVGADSSALEFGGAEDQAGGEGGLGVEGCGVCRMRLGAAYCQRVAPASDCGDAADVGGLLGAVG